MEKLLYARYSNERAPRFSVFTEILENDEGRRIVRKHADGSRADAHIRSILQSFEMLRGLYADDQLQINRCEAAADGIELEYLEGETWETVLDAALLEGGPEHLCEEMQRYLKLVLPEEQLQPFRMTEEYRDRFGEIPEAFLHEKKYRSLPVTDVDLIPANVMKTPAGNEVRGYCAERSLCDILNPRNHTDIQVISDAYKNYVLRKDRNIPLLSEYALKLHVEKKLRKYLEVLL